MKTNVLIAVLGTTALAITCLVAYAAGTDSPKPTDGKTAYAQLESLVGEWQADTSMGKAHATYESIAGGSALVERDTMEHMPPMETVFYLDGNRLLLTHYCDLGNQPRLEARAFDGAGRETGVRIPGRNQSGHPRRQPHAQRELPLYRCEPFQHPLGTVR